jgi:hypothetical protein
MAPEVVGGVGESGGKGAAVICKKLGTTSVQIRERRNGLAVPKRHQVKHLEFCFSEFGTSGSEVQILSPRPF